MRTLVLTAMLAAAPLFGTTLEFLSMDELVQKSTGIVRGHVNNCTGSMRRDMVYTVCQVSIAETWKGPAAGQTNVWIPGGTVNRVTQHFSGMPNLVQGQDYVLFLWAGPSGLNQLIGLTQGVFELKADGKSGVVAERAAASERMVNAAGQPVTDQPVRYTAAELKKIVTGILARSERQ